MGQTRVDRWNFVGALQNFNLTYLFLPQAPYQGFKWNHQIFYLTKKRKKKKLNKKDFTLLIWRKIIYINRLGHYLTLALNTFADLRATHNVTLLASPIPTTSLFTRASCLSRWLSFYLKIHHFSIRVKICLTQGEWLFFIYR